MNGLEELILRYGGRKDFWLSHVAIVAKFVEAHARELTKVEVATHAAPATRQAGNVLMWDPTRGGMRMPHLHFGGEVYILNEAQWAEFSKTAVSALAQRITRAQNVTFEGVMQLSDTVAGM